MLITFSQAPLAPHDTHESALRFAAWGVPAVEVKWTRGREVRFTLPGATVEQHESVIRALLELDPLARIRTARAVYEGRDDYLAQVKARA